MEVTVKIVNCKSGAGTKATAYAAIIFQNKQVGFITVNGIWLEMYHEALSPFGTYQLIDTGNVSTFAKLCKIVKNNWDAMYDRYPLAIKK